MVVCVLKMMKSIWDYLRDDLVSKVFKTLKLWEGEEPVCILVLQITLSEYGNRWADLQQKVKCFLSQIHWSKLCPLGIIATKSKHFFNHKFVGLKFGCVGWTSVLPSEFTP